MYSTCKLSFQMCLLLEVVYLVLKLHTTPLSLGVGSMLQRSTPCERGVVCIYTQNNKSCSWLWKLFTNQVTGNPLTEGRLLVPVCILTCIRLHKKMMAASIAFQVWLCALVIFLTLWKLKISFKFHIKHLWLFKSVSWCDNTLYMLLGERILVFASVAFFPFWILASSFFFSFFWGLAG